VPDPIAAIEAYLQVNNNDPKPFVWTATEGSARPTRHSTWFLWHLLDATQRNVVRARLNPGEVQWRRGMAWVFEQAMGLVGTTRSVIRW
jgi:hypothetical protein